MQAGIAARVLVPALALSVMLGACAGPAAQAKPTVAASSGAAPAGAAAPAKPPGPYTANGETDGSSGKASLALLDTMKFQPNTIVNAKAGQPVSLELKNSGATVHSFMAPALGVPNKATINPGQTQTVTFTAPSQAGTYFYWCPQPGHAEAGMVGQVQVK
jgi:uncharacterized cupredoxin-like copper-binding protein